MSPSPSRRFDEFVYVAMHPDSSWSNLQALKLTAFAPRGDSEHHQDEQIGRHLQGYCGFQRMCVHSRFPTVHGDHIIGGKGISREIAKGNSALSRGLVIEDIAGGSLFTTAARSGDIGSSEEALHAVKSFGSLYITRYTIKSPVASSCRGSSAETDNIVIIITPDGSSRSKWCKCSSVPFQ
jgi:hypothetical protein